MQRRGGWLTGARPSETATEGEALRWEGNIEEGA
jgi:hypothetical protein